MLWEARDGDEQPGEDWARKMQSLMQNIPVQSAGLPEIIDEAEVVAARHNHTGRLPRGMGQAIRVMREIIAEWVKEDEQLARANEIVEEFNLWRLPFLEDDDALQMEPEDLQRVVTWLAELEGLAKKMERPLPADLAEMAAKVRLVWSQFMTDLHEEERKTKIRQRQASRVEVHPVDRKCSSCGKKPAKVDDLCKRCAHAAGVMPHGKIGAA